MPFSRRWTPCLLLLLALTLVSGGVGAEEISKPDADAILERYLQGTAIDSAAALRELEAATDFYRQAGEALRHAQSLVLLGMAYDAGRRHPEAVKAYREAQQALAALGDPLGVAFLEMHMGDSATRIGDFAEAEDHYARALPLLQGLKTSGETLSSSMLIFVLRMAGLPPQLFEGGEAGIKVFVDQVRPVILAVFEIEVLQGLMESKLGRADCAGARNVLEQAREQRERLPGSQLGWLGSRMIEEQMKNGERRLADVCGVQSPPAEHPSHDAADELADLRQRMEEAERKGDLAGLVQLLSQQASVFQLEGDFDEAATALERSLTIARKLPDPRLHARALDNLGAHLLLWNRYEEAVTHLEQALTIYRRLGSDLDVAAILLQLGATNSVLGFHETALHQLEEARRLAREHKVFSIESEAACGVAQTYGLMGDFDKALGSLQGYRDRGNLVDQLKVRAVVTTLLVHRGRLEEAEQQASAILPTAEQIGAFAIAASLKGNLAYIAWNRGQADQAFAHLDRAQEIHRANGLRYLEAATSALKAVWLYRQGQTADGVALYRQAIDLYEQIQGSLRVPDLLSGLNDEGYQFYEGFIEILAAEGKAEEAFEYSERARARALLNVLGNRRIGRAAGAPRELIDTAEELRGKLRGLEISLQSLGASSSQGDRLKQLADIRGEYSETLRRLKLADPEYAQLVQVGTTSLDQLRHQVLADNTTLVEFFVTSRRTLAWMIDRETFKMVEIGANQDELKRRVKELRELLDPQTSSRGVSRGTERLTPSTEARIRESASRLYRLLITPLKPHLRHERLIIVPHGVLHYLPFAALWDAESQHYLVESHVLRYAPSASVLPHLRAKRTADRGRAMVVGDPALGLLQSSLQALPAARSEAKTIAKLLGTTAALGTAATESLVLARAGKVDLLHLAAHGIYDERDPEFSRIELAADAANDGHLEVHELMSGVDFSGVDLVVLSACESGLGDRSNGDEIVGLSRAMFYAGSPAVMATLWQIDDRATEVLMKEFYQRRKGGEPADEALRTAQLEMLARPRWRSPYFWAAFTLSGYP